MANTVQYGLQFNTDDMKKLLALAEKLDKQIKSTIDAQASNKAINAAKQETAEITKKTNALKEENKAKAYANKLALENINLDIKRSQAQWKQSGVNSIAGQYGTKYKLTGFKDFDATTLAQKKANIDLLNDKINNQKKIISLQKKFETDMLSISKKYIKASKNMTEEEFRELEDVYYRHYSKIRGYSKENAQRLAQDEIKTLKKQREQAIKPPKPIKPTIFKDPQIALTAFAEKEMVSLKKQSLMMNKKLTKKHLEELETLYKHYYTKIKGLDQKSAADLTKQQLANVKQRQKINSNIANVPMRVGKYIATSTAVYGGLSALRSGMGAIIEYDQALNNVYMAMKNVTEQDKIMLKSITQNSELTAKYGKDYAQIANSIEVLVKAGLSLNEANVLLEPSLKLAAAGGLDLDEAARSLTQSLRNIGKPMGYAGEMADALAAGAAISAVDVKDLIISLEGVGAAGKTFGMGAKETIAWIGALGNVGLKGREAANAISRMWLRITKPQKEVKDILAKRGIDLFEGFGNERRLKSFETLMGEIANSTMSLAEKQKLLGVHAFKTGEQIQTAVSSYKNMANEMDRVNGEAERMAKQKMEGIGGKLETMKSMWNDIFISQNGISNAMGGAIDKLIALLKMMTDNPTITKMIAITGATGAGAVAGTMALPGWGTLGGAVAGGTSMVALLWDMEGSVKYTSDEMVKIQANAKLAADNLLLWQERFKTSLQDTKKVTLSALKTDLLNSNLRLEERIKREKELDEVVNKKEEAYNIAKKAEENTGRPAVRVDKSGKIIDMRSFDRAATAEALKQLKIAEQNKLSEMQKNQYLRTRIDLIRSEITLREQKLEDGSERGKSSKERYDDLDSFYKKLFALSNDYRQKEFDNVDKDSAELNAKYEELYLELYNMKLKDIDRKKALDYLEQVNTLGNTEMIADLIILGRKKAEEEELKAIKEFSDAKQKVIDEEYENRLKVIEDAYEKEKEVREKYQGLAGKLSDLKDQQKLELEAAGTNEQLKFNIRKAYAEQSVQLAYETWQKEHEFANATMGAIGSAYDTFSQSLTDIDMNGKDRREAIWESFRSSAITAIMDVLKQKIIAWGLEMSFDSTKKTAEGAASAAAIGTAATAAAAGTAPMAAYAAATNSAALATSLLTGGATAVSATAALAGLTTATAAYMAVLAGGGALTAGFGVADAIVADGVVHPYRKDDLVMIGTGLGSKSGAQIPNQALPEGSGGNSSNAALLRELQNLRFAVASGNASVTKAIADNTPTFAGEVLSPVKIYKKTLIGKNQANFIVNNNA